MGQEPMGVSGEGIAFSQPRLSQAALPLPLVLPSSLPDARVVSQTTAFSLTVFVCSIHDLNESTMLQASFSPSLSQ